MSSTRRLPPAPQLIAFEMAARLQSFSAAAQALGTSQPAISQRVAGLEAELGVALFRRLARGVALTPAGSRLLAALSQGLDLIEGALAEIQTGGRSRRLLVATDFGFAAYWLLPRLGSLRRAVPGIDIRVITTQGDINPREETVDVAIIFGSGGWPGCDADLLFPEVVLPVCSPGLLAGRAKPRRPEDLRRLPLLHLESGGGDRWLDWAAWFAAFPGAKGPGSPKGEAEKVASRALSQRHAGDATVKPGGRRSSGRGAAPASEDHSLTINNYILVIQAAISGQGIALGWRPLVDDLLASGQLVPALDASITTDHGYYLVQPRLGSRSPMVKRFGTWLRAQLRTNPA
jgi:LysR family transcriptional regulator, glycine cleavage system transcriptional activator